MASGLRERKKAETRRALASAALRLARELGPDGVTVEAIAEAAGVSPRTFFNYFASKDDAIVNISPTEQSMLLADLCDRPEDEPPLDALRAMVQAAAERFAEDADEMLVRHRLAQEHPSLAMRRSARFAEVERALAEEIARRTGLDVDADTYPALVVAAALGALRVATAVWNETGRTRPLPELVDQAFDQLAAGLNRAAAPASPA